MKFLHTQMLLVWRGIHTACGHGMVMELNLKLHCQDIRELRNQIIIKMIESYMVSRFFEFQKVCFFFPKFNIIVKIHPPNAVKFPTII